jgi:hypothetical protein
MVALGLSVYSFAMDQAPDPKNESSASISGKYCVNGADGKGLKLFMAQPSSEQSLNFGLSVWFESGQHCGLVGNAKAIGGGWRYTPKSNSGDPSKDCILDINVRDGEIIVNADAAGQCLESCGGGSAISDIRFPLASKESTPVSRTDFEPETLFNTACTP